MARRTSHVQSWWRILAIVALVLLGLLLLRQYSLSDARALLLGSSSSLPVFPPQSTVELSLPAPHEFLSYSHAEGLPITVSPAEEKDPKQCTFVPGGVDPAGFDVCSIEAYTRRMIRKYIVSTDSVFEFGARFGTASCEVAHVQRNSGSLVAVEPDAGAWGAIMFNRARHRCNFWLLRGVVASQPVTVFPDNFGTRASPAPAGARLDAGDVRSSLTLREVTALTGVAPTVLIIDCEGCIANVFSGVNATLAAVLRHVRVIILEADMADTTWAPNTDCKANCVDYSVWERDLMAAGFAIVEKEPDPAVPWVKNLVFVRTHVAAG